MALSSDSRLLAVAWDDGMLVLHSLLTESSPFRQDTSKDLALPWSKRGEALAFSPDGRWLFGAGGKREVLFWKLEGLSAGAEPQRLLGSPVRVAHIHITADARSVVTVGANWIMRRWRFDGPTLGTNPRQIAVGGHGVREIEISPDGQWMACACDGVQTSRTDDPRQEGWVVVSRIDSGQSTRLGAHGNHASGVAFSNDGHWLASAGNQEIRAWDFKEMATAIDSGKSTPPPAMSFTDPSIPPLYPIRLAWFPNGRLCAVHGGGNDLRWDFTLPDPYTTTLTSRVHSILYQLPDVARSPDGRFKAVARHGWDAPEPGNLQHGNQVLLFAGDWKHPDRLLHALPANFLNETNLAFSPDGRWLAAGGDGKPPCLWDLNAADLADSRREAPITSAMSAALAFSPDGRRLAIGTSSNTLHFWEWQNPDPAKNFLTIRTTRPINTIAWHPDGRLLTGGTGQTVALWETDRTKLLQMARTAAGRTLTETERERFGIVRK